MMKQRIISVIIAVLAMVSMARGATDYGLIIGGVNVTSDNYETLSSLLTSQGILTTGTVTFDPESATLTMDGATINCQSTSAIQFKNTCFQRFKVKLIGDNSVYAGTYGFNLFSNAIVIVDGPGKLWISDYIYMNSDSKLIVRDVKQFFTTALMADQGTAMGVFNSKVIFGQNNYGALGGLYLQGVRYENPEVYFDEDRGCFHLPNGVNSIYLLPHPTIIDYNSDGAINDGDIDLWHYKKLGLDNLPNVANVQGDLNQDGELDAADLVMFNNYKKGTRNQPWRAVSYLIDDDTEDIITPGTERSLVYTQNKKSFWWAMIDTSEPCLRIDDQDASHFYCSSWDSSIAEASVVPVTIYNGLTSYGFKITVKQSGHTVIVCTYEDGNGHTVRMEVPISCFKESEVLSSSDRIYAVEEGDNGLKNIELNPQMTVPVGTTMKLSVDRKLEGGYGLDVRRIRIAATEWTVEGNDNVKVKKTSDGYVEVKVEGAGAFTIRCYDCNHGMRSARFKARDVYAYNTNEVTKNGFTYLFVPEAKTSETMGKAKKVDIKKMVTHNGDVWTIINHYSKKKGSPIGNVISTKEYQFPKVPVYAQVFCNQELFYESEDTWLEDIALYENHAIVVGCKYDPSLEFGGTGVFEGYELKLPCYSFKLSAFFAHLDINTKEVSETLNPFGHKRESCLNKVVYNERNGQVSMLGFSARQRKALALFDYDYVYPHDWAYMRWNSDATQLLNAQKRKDNDDHTYVIEELTVAGNTVLGLIQDIKYHARNVATSSVFFCADEFVQKLFYNFNDYEDGGSKEIEENEHIHNLGIASSSYDNPLYMWINFNKVYKYSDDFMSRELFTEIPEHDSIHELKVVKNGTYPEEFFYSNHTKYLNSIFGNVPFCYVLGSYLGFDLMMY